MLFPDFFKLICDIVTIWTSASSRLMACLPADEAATFNSNPLTIISDGVLRKNRATGQKKSRINENGQTLHKVISHFVKQ